MTKITSCPICRGEIHSIAGRCKHCKADLVELRERAARAARAHARASTVPPMPRAPTRPPRAATVPPTMLYAPAPPLDAPGQVPFASEDDPGPGSTIVDHPPELFAAAPEPPPPPLYYAPPPIPSNGTGSYSTAAYQTGSYSLGFAAPAEHRLAQSVGRTMRRASTWSRRWPLLVSAVALLAIGISIGVLAERWRRDSEARAAGRARQSHMTRRPVMVPDRMPQPLIPRLQSPGPEPEDREPPAQPAPSPDRDPAGGADGTGDEPSQDGPDAQAAPANPGSRFSEPRSREPDSDANAFRTFTASLTESLCHKLTQCGIIDSTTQSTCQAFAQELDPNAAADKVARGECSFNRRAADACLQAVSSLRCDMGPSDRMWDWLTAPNRVGECAEAYVCQ